MKVFGTKKQVWAVFFSGIVVGSLITWSDWEVRPPIVGEVLAKTDAGQPQRKTYYPNTEELEPNEMRIISLGTGMPNQRKSQASACWLVELGNGQVA